MKHSEAFNAGREGDLHGMIREVGSLVDAFAEALGELDGQKVTGADGTGRVVATVSGSGRLLHVRIDPRAMRDLDHVALGRAVQEAVGAARGAMAESLSEAMGALGGLSQPGSDHDPLAPYFDAILREGDHGRNG
ncbi:YbaB/EbfC family nucleoid-associated protein [Streptosporangium sp. NBC_01756]|uniref:YbaB/EbfC family nucleoid-associated protein n=1 Tax=Streptosporangium sp. NBC_01756 TaxID=2975950 RepID=UPI002DD98867|nr:YbaB/EbfC family nucleoid-associated protein [Streptosporangium sp. NBC_01756]WSC83587.1 YbaB/EbfC family nucleoid-associated protein [Streptosporangium sp. NBC_01756]